jgi:hypothetical protein
MCCALASVVACVCACAGATVVRDGAVEPSPRKRVLEPLPARPPSSDRLAWARRLQAEPDAGVRAATCARELAIDERWTDCEARSCGRAAVVLEATLDCGADSCDGHAYVMTERGQVAALPYGGHKACAPDGSFVVADVQVMPSEDALADARQWQVVLHKVAIDGSAPVPFANCMSPALAPDGETFLCRDRSGALLQVGLDGGETRLIAESGVPPEQVEYNPQSYVYPTPPRFVDGVVRFAVESSEGPIELGVPWPPPGDETTPPPLERPAEPAPKAKSRPAAPRAVPRDPCGSWQCDSEGNCDGADPNNCVR